MRSALYQWWLVSKRELFSLLSLPLYFILCGIFFLLTSLTYLNLLLEFARGGVDSTVNVTESVIRPTFHSVHFFLLMQIPLLTMRGFAEDRASGMMDLLQTTPLKSWSLLAGKFTGTLLGILVYIAITASFPLTTAFLTTVEWPVVIGSLVVLTLSSAGYVAIGLFFSSTTESQVVAAVLSFVAIFLVAFGRFFAENTGIMALDQALRHFTATDHVAMILSGNIAPMNIMYFVCLCAIFLFFTARILESQRWRA